jgi:hypothetical protein
MHSFHQSRGRILFEVFCTLGISASCVFAWMQTYAPAMLGVAGFAGLYGLVHLFDMARRNPPVAAPVEVSAPVTDDRGDLLVYLEEDEPELLLEAEPQVVEAAEEAQPPVAEPVQESEPEVVEPLQQREPAADVVQEAEPEAVVEPVQEAEPEAPDPVEEAAPIEPAHDEPEYSPVAPLFEAEPFVRQQRAAFGRRRAG